MTTKLNEIIISGKGLFICHSGGSQLSVNIKPFPNSPFAHSPLLCLPLHYPPLHLVTQHCTVLHYCNTFSCTAQQCMTLHSTTFSHTAIFCSGFLLYLVDLLFCFASATSLYEHQCIFNAQITHVSKSHGSCGYIQSTLKQNSNKSGLGTLNGGKS